VVTGATTLAGEGDELTGFDGGVGAGVEIAVGTIGAGLELGAGAACGGEIGAAGAGEEEGAGAGVEAGRAGDGEEAGAGAGVDGVLTLTGDEAGAGAGVDGVLTLTGDEAGAGVGSTATVVPVTGTVTWVEGKEPRAKAPGAKAKKTSVMPSAARAMGGHRPCRLSTRLLRSTKSPYPQAEKRKPSARTLSLWGCDSKGILLDTPLQKLEKS
jgi:hypothetical protein